MTGARVFVRKEPRMVAGTPERCVVVRGTLAQVEAAERMLAELLLEAARNGQLPANPNPRAMVRVLTSSEESAFRFDQSWRWPQPTNQL